MDEKDRQIERLFDDYASSLEPNAHLADKAKQKMRSKRKEKRPIFWVGLVAACAAAVAIAVFSVSSFLGSDDSQGNGADNSAAPTIPPVQSYSISEVRAVSVDYDFAKDYINTIELGEAEVFSQNYYACYIKDTDEFAYFKAVLGVSYNSGNIQISVVAEKPQYVCTERVQDYGVLVKGNGYRYYTEYVKGEYVTMAYCRTEDCKYYVSAMGNVGGAQQVAARIIGQ